MSFKILTHVQFSYKMAFVEHNAFLPLEFHPITRLLADLAADFKAQYKMSLADACAAALAKEKKAELVTGVPEFKMLEGEIKNTMD